MQSIMGLSEDKMWRGIMASWEGYSRRKKSFMCFSEGELTAI